MCKGERSTCISMLVYTILSDRILAFFKNYFQCWHGIMGADQCLLPPSASLHCILRYPTPKKECQCSSAPALRHRGERPLYTISEHGNKEGFLSDHMLCRRSLVSAFPSISGSNNKCQVMRNNFLCPRLQKGNDGQNKHYWGTRNSQNYMRSSRFQLFLGFSRYSVLSGSLPFPSFRFLWGLCRLPWATQVDFSHDTQ